MTARLTIPPPLVSPSCCADVLQFDNTLDDSINRIVNAHRTCDLILGISDSQPGGGFRGVEYSHSVAKFFDDKNMEPTGWWGGGGGSQTSIFCCD